MSRRAAVGTALLAAALAGGAAAASADRACPPATGVAVQVLGSGGPIADDGRASSSYLVWLDGQARVLVDVGGGSLVRLGEAGARFEDLDIVALSHFHTDHAADFPALLKSGYFSPRQRPLVVSGPAGGGPYPGLGGILAGLLDAQGGAFGYLSGYLDGTGGMARLEPVEIGGGGEHSPVLANDRVRITALPVPHGIVPTVAYRVEARGFAVVFGADQNGSDEAFARFAAGADMLIMHMAIPPSASGAALALHATPQRIGWLAAQAGARQLLLSHFMARSLEHLSGNLAEVGRAYSGPIREARDLACHVL